MNYEWGDTRDHYYAVNLNKNVTMETLEYPHPNTTQDKRMTELEPTGVGANRHYKGGND